MKSTNQTNPAKQKPKVAIVLSTGGIRAFAALPLFEFLKSHQIDVDLMIGTSGGGIICVLEALYATQEEIIAKASQMAKSSAFRSLDYRSVLNLANLPFGHFDESKGLIKKDKVLDAIEAIVGDTRLEQLQTKTILQTTDLLTGEGVPLLEGRLVEALYATGCIYPIFPPIKINDRWLIDGAYSAPLPILEAYKQGADLIVAMYFMDTREEFPGSFLKALDRITGIGIRAALRSQLALAIDVHHYEIFPIKVYCKEPVGLGEIEKVPLLMEWGKEALAHQAEGILAAVEAFGEGKL